MLMLRFKSKAVRDFEKENGSIFDLMDPSVDNLIKLIQLGNDNCSEDRAFEILDAELENEESDTISVLTDIMKGLQRYGFFPKKVNMLIIQKQLETSISKINKDMEKQLEEETQVVKTPQEKKESKLLETL